MKSFLSSTLVFFAILGTCTSEVQAQANRLLTVEDWTYEYIERLQRRGYLLDLNPTALPYRQGDVAEAVDHVDRASLSPIERRWLDLLAQAVTRLSRDEQQAVVGASIEGGIAITNSDRLDPVRPLGDTLNLFPYGVQRYYLDRAPFVAEISVRHDTYYDQDPDGLDVARRALARSENTYVGYNGSLFSAYLGRFNHHWSVPGEASAFLSNNPRTYDQLHLRLGGQRLSVSSLLGELDSVTDDGRFTGRVADDTVRVGNRRRFLAAHRWDWRPSRHLTLSIMEAAIYSSSTSGISLRYLNPVHPFVAVVDNTPKNDQNNGFVGGLIWAQFQRWTLHGQLMFDDIDFLGKGNESASFTGVGSLTYAGRVPWLDLGATLTVVTPLAYNTNQPEGKYLFMKRGLATQFNDFVHASVFADLYLDAVLPGLRLTPTVHVLAQGERDILDPFPPKDAPIDPLLEGTVERTVRSAIEVRFQRDPRWWIRLDGGLNVVSNKNHVPDASESTFVVQLEFGLRLSLNRAYRLALP